MNKILKKICTTTAALTLTGAAWSQAAFAAPIIYSQPWDGTSNMFASQNDIGGNGNFATSYDDFTLSQATTVTDVHWTGGYFNPANQGTISAFTIRFYADAASQPGAAIYTTTIAGNGNQTSLGNINGFPMFTYSVDLTTDFLAAANTRYWISIVADSTFPPQWGLAVGTGGNGVAFQDFIGSRGQIPDLAFELSARVPEPGSLPLALLALTGLVALRRKSVAG